MKRTLLGTGRLTWDIAERVTNRYGYVYLLNSGDSLSAGFDPAPLKAPFELQAKDGQLVVEVLETRESTHIGDFFLGIFPETPQVGEKFSLGRGKFSVIENYGGTPAVGLIPAEARDQPWLDPTTLYRAHEQTVNLYFESE